MFLKRERPETDDFAIKKYQVVHEKYSQYFKKCEICVFRRHPYKNIPQMSLHIFTFQNI